MDFLNDIQMGDDDQLSYAVSQKIATKSRARSMGLDMISAAVTGKPPLQYFEELNQEAQDVADQSQKIADARNKLTSDIASLKPRPVDDSGYRAAVDAYHQALGNAPVAPQLEQMQLNDTDKAMMGFALLLGASPNQALTRFMQVKQGLVDQRNQQTQQQFQNDYGQYTQNLRGLQSEVGIQGDMYGNAVAQSNTDYNRELSGLNTGLKDLQGQADDQRMESQRVQTAINNYERNAQDFFESMGGSIDENTYRNAIQSAQNLEQTQGLPQGSLTSILNAKYQTGATLKAKQFEAQKAQWRATFDQRIKEFETNSKIKLDHEKAWLKWLDIQTAMNDRKMDFMEANAAFDQWARTEGLKNDSRALDIREKSGDGKAVPESTTQKKYNDLEKQVTGLDAEIAGLKEEARATTDPEDKAKLVAKLRGKEGERKTIYDQWMKTAAQLNNETRKRDTVGYGSNVNGGSTGSIKQWGNEFKSNFKGSRVEQFGPGSIKASLHPKGLALDLNAKNNDPKELEKYLEYSMSQKVPYIIYNRKSYTLQPNGQYRVKDYTGPNPHLDHVHVDWKGKGSSAIHGSSAKGEVINPKPPVKQATKPAKQAQPQAPKTSTGNTFTKRGK